MKTIDEKASDYGTQMGAPAGTCGQEPMDTPRRPVSEMYDKTSRAVSSTYSQAVRYSRENPGKTTLIALGIGFGIGLMMGSGPRSRTSRIAQPVINALTDIASEFIR